MKLSYIYSHTNKARPQLWSAIKPANMRSYRPWHTHQCCCVSHILELIAEVVEVLHSVDNMYQHKNKDFEPVFHSVPYSKGSLWTWHVTSPLLQNETPSVKCLHTSGDFMRNLTELFLCTGYKKQKEWVNSFSWHRQHWQRNPLFAYCALLTISIKQFGQNFNSANDLMDGGNRTFCYITK